MFLPGTETAKFLEGLKDEQVQPAGIDLTVDRIFAIDEAGEIDYSNENRKVPEGRELEFSGKIHLDPGTYRIVYNEVVAMPEDAIGVGLPRSSLMRMGGTVVCGLWDPGYKGRSQGLLVVFNPKGITVHRNARLVQLFLIKGGKAGKYSGAYQNENL